MRVKFFFATVIATGLCWLAKPAFSQVAPAAREASIPFSVGAGVSNFDMDWGHTRMYGGTLWADWHPQLPRFLNGLGIEAEARDIDYGRPAELPSNFRQDTAGGGIIYTWHHFRNFRPYGKGLIEFGSFDFRSTDPYYSHDTRTVYAPGLGLEFRAYHHLWVRADYEYQFWPNLLGFTADPQGFTVGAIYDFRHIRFHR